MPQANAKTVVYSGPDSNLRTVVLFDYPLTDSLGDAILVKQRVLVAMRQPLNRYAYSPKYTVSQTGIKKNRNEAYPSAETKMGGKNIKPAGSANRTQSSVMPQDKRATLTAIRSLQ